MSQRALGLLRRVALNPAVTMGHTYVTKTVDERTGKILFIGDLADARAACGTSGMLPGR